MKKLLILQGTNLYTGPQIRGTFLTPQLAYDYVNDYLDYLETDAKEYLGGEELEKELLRLSIIRKRLPEILDWDLNDKKNFYFLAKELN